ncbi:MAG: hypothetical protein ACJ77O_13900, partial [Chloroflexota bacterium]
SSEDAATGCVGFLVGSGAVLVAIVALALTGFEFPAGLPDVVDDLRSRGYRHGIGEAIVLAFAWIASMVAAISVAYLVEWLAMLLGAAKARADRIAEVAAAAFTVVYVVALGLLGDSWAVLPAATFLVVFVFLLANTALHRLRRCGAGID